MVDFTQKFLDDTIRIIEKISSDDINRVAQILRNTRDADGRLFICGSGGGAGHASHATCDFRKLAGFEAYCVTDNVSELTARTNDDGWDNCYSDWLVASRLRKNVFSVGGGSIDPPVSMNLVAAVHLAKERDAFVVGVVGRQGGVLRKLADASVLIPVINDKSVTPQTEGLQAVIWHLLVSHPILSTATAKWEGLAGSTATGLAPEN